MQEERRRPGRPKLSVVQEPARLPSPGLPKLFHKNNKPERAFLLRAVERRKGAAIIRHGWPDFMLIERGKAYCVEVKCDQAEPLSWRQKQTAAALDVAGIETFVWSPDREDRLVPWRRWGQSKAAKAREAAKASRRRYADGTGR